MKALVLAGGLPQAALIEKLKKRGIITILADYSEHPVAEACADRFYRISTLDVGAVRNLAKAEQVDFLITVCTDQALLTVAQVSEELGLPCYLDHETARNATNKAYMKDVFAKHGIPTARYVIMERPDIGVVSRWDYPLIAKPVDCNSSKGVRKAADERELAKAVSNAFGLSRSRMVVVEEFIEGRELSVDVYVEEGKAIVLDITVSEKINDKEKFVIFRTWHLRKVNENLKKKIDAVAQQIADAFGVRNAPMLIQMLTDGDQVYVIEFSVRTGGGVKHLSIQRSAGVDVIDAVIDLTLGIRPSIQVHAPGWNYMLDEYIYCGPGVYDHTEGFEELKKSGVILDHYVFRAKGTEFGAIENSGDRIGGFTIVADTKEELTEKHLKTNQNVHIISADGKDMMRHDLSMGICWENIFETVDGGEL